jgi:hypothetical protein
MTVKTIISPDDGLVQATGVPEEIIGGVILAGAAYMTPPFILIEGIPPDDRPGWHHDGDGWVPPPLSPGLIAAMVRQYDGIVQGRLDSVVRDTFRYGDPNRPEVPPVLFLTIYHNNPAVPKFNAEARLLTQWIARTWAASAAILDAVTAGERQIPTEAELLAELEEVAPAPTHEDVEAEIERLTA